MITFNKLADGLFFYTNCPLCGSALHIKNEGMTAYYSGANNNYGFLLKFYLEQQDKVTINPLTEDIEIEQSNYHSYDDYNYSMYNNKRHIYSSNHTRYNYSYESFPLDVNCKGCSNFDYSIDIQIDFISRKIVQTALNQIIYGIKNDDLYYQIVNDYYKNKSTLMSPTDKRLIEVPLIHINKENLNHSFERLKKLIIFT